MSIRKRIGTVLCLTAAWLLFSCPAPAQDRLADWPSDPPAAEIEQLSNGLRVTYLPDFAVSSRSAGTVDIGFGYAVGLRERKGHHPGTSAVVSRYLAASVPGRRVALVAHLAGGTFATVDDPELIGMRLTVPRPALEAVLEQIADYFGERTPDPEILDYTLGRYAESSAAPSDQFRREVSQSVGRALLGEDFDLREFGAPGGMDPPEPEGVRRYFERYLGIDRAYLILSEPIRRSWLARFEALDSRGSEYASPLEDPPDAEGLALEFPSRSQGGMILATAIPSVHFEGWFQSLAVDRFLRDLDGSPSFELGRSLEPSIHWIQVQVGLPGFPEEARAAVMQRLARFIANPDPESVDRVRRSTLEYLAEREVQEWFAAHGLSESMRAGWRWVETLTPGGLVAAVQSFAAARRVTAMWSPAFIEPTVTVESLSEPPVDREEPRQPTLDRVPGRVRVPAFETAETPVSESVRLERLDSGVTLAGSNIHGLFVAGRFDGTLPGGHVTAAGTNGTLWLFDALPGAAALEALDIVRPDRLLFLVPSEEFPAARSRFRVWTGGQSDSTASLAVGDVATIDMPAILVLKTWLEAKVIEAGWWGEVTLRVAGTEGARLVIEADQERSAQVEGWIAEVADQGISEAEFRQVRAAALGYFERIRRDLQIVLWQRAPEGAIQPPDTVTPERLQTVARIYF